MPSSPPIGARFNEWVSEHVAVLYRVAYRLVGDAHDAEDVLQDTFRSAWASRDLYDQSRSERAWLLAILRRRVADHWRKHEPREVLAGGDAPDPPARAVADPFHDELSMAMQRALGRLPGELRETLLLVVVGELTHQEAADLLGVPLGTVLSRVSRGRSRLREFLLEASRDTMNGSPAPGRTSRAQTAGNETRHG
ncbi:MAG: sigma-70 family RNA polymerase sigma factor [Planctomycetia bacterium]|nr:sigma-70 family RNA polymerase sigma factor [Planctomycetia bacterium]